MLDNTFIKRWIIFLSGIGKSPDKHGQDILWWSKCGQTRKYKVIDHHLKHCAIAHYASAVVEWSNIFENHK